MISKEKIIFIIGNSRGTDIALITARDWTNITVNKKLWKEQFTLLNNYTENSKKNKQEADNIINNHTIKLKEKETLIENGKKFEIKDN